MSKVVFVGNVPYNMGEDQLIDVFKSVGQVVGFRLVFDRDTGKPRGYGFCEFADHETAASAVRNLNNVDVGGRPLRIDLADSDPFLEGKTTVRGELVDSGESRAQWRERERDDFRSGPLKSPPDPNAFMAGLPAGVPIPPGSTSLDTISNTLGTMNPGQLIEVLAQMKAFVITHPEQARTLLITHPQLAYALFQALLLNKIVDQGILARMLAATTGGNPSVNPNPLGPGPPLPPPRVQPPFPPGPIHTPQPIMPPPSMPPAHLYQQQPQHPPPMNLHQPPAFYRPPPPPQTVPQQGPPQTAPNPAIDPAQRQMLMQVLSLTPDQINALPPDERNAIQQLRNQFIGGITV
ncbi:hypothetical protein PILCRDRAFT_118578 [Piloderma croceum F 1598]|uniref:RRM domain-containing protein n=1 Tax=Piloderma croceum (strain F 1598) TaxID=765440 RepID=A0A0C3GL66_PILCF|nr:hypothetical protein PILCRDRAFT_118578 [Piloderma croceum F 1598]